MPATWPRSHRWRAPRALPSLRRRSQPSSRCRDAALLAIGYGAGLRRAELVALDLADYNPESGELRVRRGKGRKDRLVYATNGAGDALNAWLRLRGEEPGPLFCPVDKAGRVEIRRITGQAVLYVLCRVATDAGVAAFSPPDLRRTFISDLLDRTGDLIATQHLAGRANNSTTGRYDRRGERAKRKAAELLHVPFVAAS
jgi:integrase